MSSQRQQHPNPAPSSRKPLISQSLYDETILENADLFDLESSPDAAVAETRNQFQSQGISLDHLIASHPDSESGRRERGRRGEFGRWLEELDGAVGGDGSVDSLFENGDGDDGGSSNDEANKVGRAVECLEGIGRYCSRGDGGDGGEGGGDGDGAGNGTAADGYPYLQLFRTADGIYTLMSLLGAVNVDEDAKDVVGTSSSSVPPASTETTSQQRQREEVLRAVCRTLTSILSPPAPASKEKLNPSDRKRLREIKSTVRDSFAAFDRLVGLMSYYADLLSASQQEQRQSFRTLEINGILTDLTDLAVSATGMCESNKVNFVRAHRNKGVGTVVEAMKLPLLELEEGSSSSCLPDGGIVLLTSLCRLTAVLCRFDDFRDPSTAASASAPSALGPGRPDPGMTVSSAHDHVLDFFRKGVVPVLAGITDLALDGTSKPGSAAAAGGESPRAVHAGLPTVGDAGAEKEEEEEQQQQQQQQQQRRAMLMTNLAGSALAATRALAVNDEIVQALVAVGTLRSAREALGAGLAVQDGKDDDGKGRRGTERRALVSASLGLLRNLCGNDEIKTNLCLGTADGNAETRSALPAVLDAMRRYRSDPAVQEHGCATLAAMALRKPDNARAIVDGGGPMEILTAMRRHPAVVPVQRQGCLAVRNVASRLVVRDGDGGGGGDGGAAGGGGGGGGGGQVSGSGVASSVSTGSTSVGAGAVPGASSAGPPSEEGCPSSSSSSFRPSSSSVDVRETFLDLGAESILRDVAGSHQGSVDEAYAALRDLGCKVSMVRYGGGGGEDGGSGGNNGGGGGGRGVRGVAMFGDSKPRFNPVFEESGVEQSIARHVEG